MTEQLDLFALEDTECQHLWDAIAGIKETNRRIQKRLFAELADTKDSLIETKGELERLKFRLGRITDIKEA